MKLRNTFSFIIIFIIVSAAFILRLDRPRLIIADIYKDKPGEEKVEKVEKIEKVEKVDPDLDEATEAATPSVAEVKLKDKESNKLGSSVN